MGREGEECLRSGGKSRMKGPLRIHRREFENNININFQHTVWCGMDWIHLAQDGDQSASLVNMVMNLWIPQNVG
jgi:hypothetical protein